MRRSTRTEAFTLVELVVAVAVAAVAMAISAVALLGGHSLASRIASGVPEFDGLMARQAAEESLRSDFACALPSSESPLEGAADGFRCLRLYPAEGGGFIPALVEWGRAPNGGAVRRIIAADGSILREDIHPAVWGMPRFSYRGVATGDGAQACSLSAPADSWPTSGLGGGGPLPAAVEVRWGGSSFVLAVPCAAPETVEGGA